MFKNTHEYRWFINSRMIQTIIKDQLIDIIEKDNKVALIKKLSTNVLDHDDYFDSDRDALDALYYTLESFCSVGIALSGKYKWAYGVVFLKTKTKPFMEMYFCKDKASQKLFLENASPYLAKPTGRFKNA